MKKAASREKNRKVTRLTNQTQAVLMFVSERHAKPIKSRKQDLIAEQLNRKKMREILKKVKNIFI